jgi:hypothetical protein
MGPLTKKDTTWVLDLYFVVTNSPKRATRAPAADVDKPPWMNILAILRKHPAEPARSPHSPSHRTSPLFSLLKR